MAIEEKKWEPLGKKHNWLERKPNLFFELIIRDDTGRKLDRFLWNTIQKFKEILELLRLKYGLEYK